MARGIDDECVFCWWVAYTLRKKDMIIAAVNNRVKDTNYKYGHKIPRTVKDAFALDRESGIDRWRKAIDKKMGNVRIAFNILDKSEGIPVGYSLAKVHLVFDVKWMVHLKQDYARMSILQKIQMGADMQALYHVKVYELLSCMLL